MSKYVYTALDQLEECPQVNVFGIIAGVHGPTRNSSGQYELILELEDQTLTPDQLPVRCKLFAEKRSSLERTGMARGDVFRVHRAKCRKDHNVLSQLILQAPIGLGGCHFVVWEALVGGNLDPKGKSSTKYTLNETDRRTVGLLRGWWGEKIAARSGMEGVGVSPDVGGGWELPGGALSTPLARFPKHAYRDIIVFVGGVVHSEENPHLLTVRCWDGTRPSMPLVSVMDPDEKSSTWKEDENWETFRHYSADLYVFDEFQEPARALKPGDVAVFRNIHSVQMTREEGWSLTMHTNRTGKYLRSITRLDPEADLTRAFLRELEYRLEGIRRAEDKERRPENANNKEKTSCASALETRDPDVPTSEPQLGTPSQPQRTSLPSFSSQEERLEQIGISTGTRSTRHSIQNTKEPPTKPTSSQIRSTTRKLSTNTISPHCASEIGRKLKKQRCSTPEFDRRLKELEIELIRDRN